MPHFPQGTCAYGADLARAADLGVAASHQEIEIPLMTAAVIQHDVHEVACGCGRVHRAAAPDGAGAPGTVTYGVNLQAWRVYLMAAHAIPVHRCAELIEALTGARPSPGFVHGMLARRVPGAKAGQPPARLLPECLHDREDDVLRFLSDLRIPPTSNQAEGDVRPAKTQQKISGRLRSENTARHRYAIRGYISTAAKHGQNALTALRDALTGSPWMPPIPDPP